MTPSEAIACSTLALLAMAPGIVFAAPASSPDDETAARVLFREGRALAAGGDYAAACPKFEESFRLDPGMGTSFNLADCLEHIGRTASAWARFLDVAETTKAAGQTERERTARARAAELEPQLSRLIIEVESPGAGTIVWRDGVPLTEALWGVAVPLDPGVHLVEAEAPQRPKWSARVTLPPAAATVSVAIPILQDQSPADRSPPPARQPPEPERPAVGAQVHGTQIGRAMPPIESAPPHARSGRQTAVAIGLGSFGVVALATGAVFALEFESANRSAKEICVDPNGVCTKDDVSRHDLLVDHARTDRTLMLVGAGVGALALVAAVYGWWAWPPGRAGSHGRAGASQSAGALTFNPGLGGVSVFW